jgi:hypothetical protein
VASVRQHRQDLPSSRTVQLEETDGGTVLKVGVSSQTNVRVALREPVTIRLPRGEQQIVELHCYADDPTGFVTQAQELLA